MAASANPSLDQFSTALGEEFRDIVDDNAFVSNMVFQDTWKDSEKVSPGRWLAVPILTSKNQNAISFGQYDPLPASAQTLYSSAAFPWSFYTVAIIMSYQELALIQGRNQRVDNLGVQLEAAIGSLGDVCGQDLTNFSPKAPTTKNGVPALGIFEATDDGSLVNTYGNINRTGTNAFLNWQGRPIRRYLQSNIGTAANDATPVVFYQAYTAATQGAQTPTDVYTTKEGTAAYMYTMQAQQRFAAGDIANPGFAGAQLFGAVLKADDHIVNPVNGAAIGCNYVLVNRNHTHFYHFTPKKGAEFVPWTNTPDGALSQIARYVISFQYASSQCRTGGQVLNVNSLANL